MTRFASTTLIAAIIGAFVAPSPPSADEGDLTSTSFRVRMFTFNSGGAVNQSSPSFRAAGCVGELGHTFHSTTSYQLLAGFCAQQQWYLAGQAVEVLFPDLVIASAMAAPAPNPTSGAVHFGVSIAPGEVGTIRVFDPGGRLVRSLLEKAGGPVSRVVTWDLRDNSGRPVAPGVYFSRFEAGSVRLTKRVVFVGR
jgi:hypothetical protein